MPLAIRVILNLLLFIKAVHGNGESNEGYNPTIEETLDIAMRASHVGFSGEHAPYQHEQDRRIELDILLTEEQRLAIENGDREKRNAIRNEVYRWENNIVPYRISSSFNRQAQMWSEDNYVKSGTVTDFSAGTILQNDLSRPIIKTPMALISILESDNEKRVILDAIELWEDVTCVEFVQKGANTRNYVDIGRGRGGCYSYVGSVGGAQELGLAKGCVTKRVVVHELGHALGLYHHQSRPDRDQFVEILYANIQDGLSGQFRKLSASTITTLSTKYDYRSVMHYGKTFFSKNGKNTIRTKDPKYQDIIGRAQQMSFVDAKMINEMYKCGQKSQCPTSRCPGEGFRRDDCKCYCPANDGVDVVLCQETEVTTKSPETTPSYPCANKKTTPATTTTTPATTTTKAPPVTVSTCKNVWSSGRCQKLKRLSRCSKSWIVRKYCKLSCGTCQAKVCFDKWTQTTCIRYKRYCSRTSSMKTHCKRTCGLC